MALHATLEAPAAEKLKPVYLPDSVFAKTRTILLAVMVIGWVLSLAGYAMGEHERFFQSYLYAYTAFTMVLLGGWFFVMVQYLTGSAWSVPVRRLMETIMVLMPVAALCFLPVAFGVSSLYEWHDREFMMRDAMLRGKASYLSPTWFFIRAGLFFGLWTLWTRTIYKNSVAQDKTGSIERMHTISRWSAPGLLVCMLSGSLAAFDWLMSLSPHWYSTIFGIYSLAGGAWCMFALLVLTSIYLKKTGVMDKIITTEHLHDLGKWMFALTVFWSYIAFSQYLLIWYANLPEETFFYRDRLVGSWKSLSGLLLFGHFVIPFLWLIPRAAKRNMTRLTIGALWIIFIHLVDHYWLVMPSFHHMKNGIHFHWLDITTVAAVLGTYAFAFWTQLKKHSILVVGDPRFEQGLAHHQ